jgi:hypothetical protein
MVLRAMGMIMGIGFMVLGVGVLTGPFGAIEGQHATE